MPIGQICHQKHKGYSLVCSEWIDGIPISVTNNLDNRLGYECEITTETC